MGHDGAEPAGRGPAHPRVKRAEALGASLRRDGKELETFTWAFVGKASLPSTHLGSTAGSIKGSPHRQIHRRKVYRFIHF